MTRDQLAHILRVAAKIAEEPDIVVIGSQAVLGTYTDDELPPRAVASMEADLAFFGDEGSTKSDRVDGGHICEQSQFHETFGYYGQGVGISTAVLPAGWRARVVVLANLSTEPGRGLCLEPHDLVVSKLVAGREKDLEFTIALIEAGPIDTRVLAERAQQLETVPAVKRRVQRWAENCAQQRNV